MNHKEKKTNASMMFRQTQDCLCVYLFVWRCAVLRAERRLQSVFVKLIEDKSREEVC